MTEFEKKKYTENQPLGEPEEHENIENEHSETEHAQSPASQKKEMVHVQDPQEPLSEIKTAENTKPLEESILKIPDSNKEETLNQIQKKVNRLLHRFTTSDMASVENAISKLYENKQKES